MKMRNVALETSWFLGLSFYFILFQLNIYFISSNIVKCKFFYGLVLGIYNKFDHNYSQNTHS